MARIYIHSSDKVAAFLVAKTITFETFSYVYEKKETGEGQQSLTYRHLGV